MLTKNFVPQLFGVLSSIYLYTECIQARTPSIALAGLIPNLVTHCDQQERPRVYGTFQELVECSKRILEFVTGGQMSLPESVIKKNNLTAAQFRGAQFVPGFRGHRRDTRRHSVNVQKFGHDPKSTQRFPQSGAAGNDAEAVAAFRESRNARSPASVGWQ